MTPYEEKLWKLLEEGKISLEQYEELRANLPGEEPKPSSGPASSLPPLPRVSPGRQEEAAPPLTMLVQACAIFLFIAAGTQLLALQGRSLSSEKGFTLFLAVIAEIGLGVCLLKMKRWAYLVLLAIALVTPLVNLFEANAAGLIINTAYLFLLFKTLPAFFHDQSCGEVWHEISGKLRRAGPSRMPEVLPVPVRALAILLLISALLNLAGPLMIHYISDRVFEVHPQKPPLHINILYFVFHAYVSMTPMKGMFTAVVVLAYRYGILRLNRIVFILLAVGTALGCAINLFRGEMMAFLMLAIRGALMIWSWRFFFPSPEGLAVEPNPSEPRA